MLAHLRWDVPTGVPVSGCNHQPTNRFNPGVAIAWFPDATLAESWFKVIDCSENCRRQEIDLLLIFPTKTQPSWSGEPRSRFTSPRDLERARRILGKRLFQNMLWRKKNVHATLS